MARARKASGGSSSDSASRDSGHPGGADCDRPVPVYAVFGPDDFLRRQALKKIEQDVLGEEPPPMARVDFEGDSAPLAEVLDEVRTLSFLAERRLVIVQDADAFVSRHREALERYVAEPSRAGALALVCKVMNKQWRLTKAIQKIGRLLECKPPPPWERGRWLSEHAHRTYGKRLAGQAADALIELTGDDMAALDAELAKLAIYVGDRDDIRTEDIEALVGLNRPEKVFRMTDALARGDAAEAMHVWHQTLASDNQAAFRAIGGVAWAVRQMIAVKEGTAGRANRATQMAASRFTREQLQDMLVQLLRADVESKTGLGSVGSAIERFIVRQSAAE